MSVLIKNHRNDFSPGLTWITRLDEPEPSTGIGLGVLKLEKGGSFSRTMEGETAALLMAGKVRFRLGDIDLVAERASLFDEDPTCVHCSANESVEILAIEDTSR